MCAEIRKKKRQKRRREQDMIDRAVGRAFHDPDHALHRYIRTLEECVHWLDKAMSPTDDDPPDYWNPKASELAQAQIKLAKTRARKIVERLTEIEATINPVIDISHAHIARGALTYETEI